MNERQPVVLDLFAGLGGFSRAFENAGYKTVAFSEIEPFPCSVLAHHWPDAPNLGDVTKIKGEDIGPVDVLTGGFPCQDLSVAGKRAGLAGGRSGLFWEIVRLAREIEPTWLVLENVPGLLSSNKGRDFGIVLDALGELGYGLSWRVLDAQNFGVPQRRRRVFIVGYLGGACPPEILFEPDGVRRDTQAGREAGKVVAALTSNGVGTCGADDNQGQAGHLVAYGSGRRGVERDVANVPTKNRVEIDTETFVTHSPTAFHETGPGWWNESPHFGTLRAEGENRPSRPSNVVGEPAIAFATSSLDSPRDDGQTPPLKANLNGQGTGAGPSVFASIGMAVRRLTPTECERLQAFPDSFTDVIHRGKPAADGPRYKALGNSVAVPCVEWIARRMFSERRSN